MNKSNDTEDLEKYLEENASQLVETNDDKSVFTKAAQEHIRKRKQRANRLQNLRLRKLRLTQKALAGAVGANLRTLQSWESGRQEYPKSVEILMELINDIPSVRKKLLSGNK